MTSKADENRKGAYTRASVKKKVEEAAGGSAVLPYYLEEEGGQPFNFPHPFFYTSEQSEAMALAEERNDRSLMGPALLGQEEYDRFILEGGTDDDVNMFLIAAGKDMQDRQKNPTKR